MNGYRIVIVRIMSSLETLYLESLSSLERSVCQIAESHLQSSFDISRSSGFIAWKAKRNGNGNGNGT